MLQAMQTSTQILCELSESASQFRERIWRTFAEALRHALNYAIDMNRVVRDIALEVSEVILWLVSRVNSGQANLGDDGNITYQLSLEVAITVVLQVNRKANLSDAVLVVLSKMLDAVDCSIVDEVAMLVKSTNSPKLMPPVC